MNQTVVVSRASGYDRITFAKAGAFGIPTPRFEWRSECLGKGFHEYHVMPDGKVINRPYYAATVRASDVLTAILNGTLTLDHVLVHGCDDTGYNRTFKLRIVNNYLIEVIEGDTVLFKQDPPSANQSYLVQKVREFNAGIKKVRELLRVRPKR
jgi:hypothetical protein